jgi:methionine-rich copper-binding protein CopC
MRTGRIALAAGSAALAVGLAAWPAQAHTSLVSATPGLNATVSPPSKVVLTYADPVRLTQVIVTDSTGRHHESGKSQAVDNTVTEQIAGTLPNGVYTVGWRVVAPDGHPVEGTYNFTVTGSTAPPTAGKGSVTAKKSGSGTTVWWIGLGVLLLVAVGVGVFFLRKGLGTEDE